MHVYLHLYNIYIGEITRSFPVITRLFPRNYEIFSRNYEIIGRKFNFKYDTIRFRTLESKGSIILKLNIFNPKMFFVVVFLLFI